ncbi:C-type lectin domain family 4 member E-like [Lepisosteus oculatus]|uniref:C-type lectin domain family 4 member E-like n=1 Tax=Lepisosteus oculatus TaxID=7918 RepID=UPI0035F51553
MESEGFYTDLVYPKENVYDTIDIGKTVHRNPESQQTGAVESDVRPRPYRLPTTCLGLMCAVLLTVIIALSVYYNVFSHSVSATDLLSDTLVQHTVNHSNLAAFNKEFKEGENSIGSKAIELNKILQAFSDSFPVILEYCPVNSETQMRRCSPCPKNWLQHNEKCYFFSSETMNWVNSRSYCSSMGVRLVIIGSVQEQAFIWKMVKKSKKDFWIGLRNVCKKRGWRWVNENRLQRYVYWKPGQPYNGEQRRSCVAAEAGVSTLNNWKNHECTDKLPWICAAEALRVPP